MKYIAAALTGSALLMLLTLVDGEALKVRAQPGQDEDSLRARGEYLTKNVAMCVQCHSPRDSRGRLQAGKYFQGAPIPVEPPSYPGQDWALQAPNIAGLGGYTEDLAVRLLTKGVTRWGTPPRPPMPPFRMNTEDARAVVAYLKSL